MKNLKFLGFTLGEVLIALVVLGLLYILTIPLLNHNYQRNVTQAGFADVFKEFNKAMFNYTVRKQCQGQLTCTGLFSEGKNQAEELSSEYQTVKIGNNCWNGKTIHNNFDGSGETTNLNNLNCFIDGKNRIFAIEPVSNCDTDYFDATGKNENKKHKLQKSCGYLFVDLNGEKSPNAFGVDVFAFIIADASTAYLYPLGGSLLKSSYSGLSKWKGTCGDGSNDGRTCAGRIVEDGWKVKYLK